MDTLLDTYEKEVRCTYKERDYLVRDNGSVCRLPKKEGRSSKLDNVWTFGTKNKDKGYMFLTGNIAIHQIVCTAFHGIPDDPHMIVDHLDTNRCNNRPENLRWITRLENVLNNPATRKKIIYYCGSIEAFLANPAILRDKVLSQDLSWMRTVSKEEAAKCKRNIERWTALDSVPTNSSKGIGDYIFNDEDQEFVRDWNGGQLLPEQKNWAQQKEEIEAENRRREEEALALKDSLTPGAKQLNWKTPTAFPRCPQTISSTPLLDYLAVLPKGAIYCQNKYGDSPVVDAGIAADGNHLSVLTKTTGATNYALSEIYFIDGAFIHKSIRSFFSEEGAQKYYTLSLGLEWKGGEVMEDSM